MELELLPSRWPRRGEQVKSDSLILGSGWYDIIILHLPSMEAETLKPMGTITRWSPDGEWLTLFTVHNDVRGYFIVNKEGTTWIPLQP